MVSSPEIWDFIGKVGDFIGKVVVYGGSSALVAFCLFRFLGEKWIEGKFAERLEAYKHAQAKELEEVRFRISSIFNRVTKLHDKEFEILPEVWGKLNDARLAVLRCAYQFRQHPNLNLLPEDQLQDFLTKKEFSEQEIQSVKQSDDRNDSYGNVITYRQIGEAHLATLEFRATLTKYRIFLMPDLRERFDNIEERLGAILISHQVGVASKNQSMWIESLTEHQKPIELLMKEIEELVRQRLRPSEPV